jgi:hypothetical protein
MLRHCAQHPLLVGMAEVLTDAVRYDEALLEHRIADRHDGLPGAVRPVVRHVDHPPETLKHPTVRSLACPCKPLDVAGSGC